MKKLIEYVRDENGVLISYYMKNSQGDRSNFYHINEEDSFLVTSAIEALVGNFNASLILSYLMKLSEKEEHSPFQTTHKEIMRLFHLTEYQVAYAKKILKKKHLISTKQIGFPKEPKTFYTLYHQKIQAAIIPNYEGGTE